MSIAFDACPSCFASDIFAGNALNGPDRAFSVGPVKYRRSSALRRAEARITR
jgi:hypothetical protein